MKLNAVILILLSGLIHFSCKSKTEEAVNNENEFVEITKAQFQSENMQFTEVKTTLFEESVHFTGNISAAANGIARIGLPLPGIISKIHCKPSQVIKKGVLLFEVSGNEFIDIQKDYAESSAILKRLKSEYERIRELHNENIRSQKEYISAESEFFAERAKNHALRVKLENVGADVRLIETGTIFPSYVVVSPIQGNVSVINAMLGQFIEPNQYITEIIDAGTYQLQLSVFGKDISKISVGQPLNYYVDGNKSEIFTAKISSKGSNIAHETKTITCYAQIKDSDKARLINNQYAEGDIIISADTAVSLPLTAIMESANETYMLILEKETTDRYYFRRTKINTGRKNEKHVELKDTIAPTARIADGVYNIRTE
ncbi:MAG: efflux RND transporter periplasmic adaptor subunit [Bacteroidales bacterium]|nr:efflux RND transporter periplasmic adaptor subunit [Bacteroidales bacterium]